MGKFVESVNSTPEARQELENWGLSFENDTIHVSLVWISFYLTENFIIYNGVAVPLTFISLLYFVSV